MVAQLSLLQQCYHLKWTPRSQAVQTNRKCHPGLFLLSSRFPTDSAVAQLPLGITTVRAVTQRYSNFCTWGLLRLVERRPDGNITSHANFATSGLLKAHVTGMIVSDEDNTAPSSGTWQTPLPGIWLLD